MGLAYHIEVFLKGLATLFWINAECGKLHGTIARGYSQEQATSEQAFLKALLEKVQAGQTPARKARA